jgi:hypothetical protein
LKVRRLKRAVLMTLCRNRAGRAALRAREIAKEQWLDWRLARTETARPRLLEQEIASYGGLGVGFFCGLGDLLYSLPVLAQVKQHCRSHNLALAAYISQRADTNSNPRCAALARTLRLFDKVETFPSIGTARYWKAYDTSAARKLAAAERLAFRPFIYDIQGARSRCRAIARSLNTRLGFADHFATSIPEREISPAMRELASKLSGKEVVVYHGEARSSSYTASFSEDVVEFLSQAGLTVVSFSPLRKLSAKAKERIHEVSTGKMSFADTLFFLNRLRPRIVAVNSVFWPLAYLLGLDLFGIHILRGGSDVHQFWYPKFQLLTAVQTNETRRLREQGAAAIISLDQTQAVQVLKNSALVSFSGDALRRELFVWLKFPPLAASCPLGLPEFSLRLSA